MSEDPGFLKEGFFNLLEFQGVNRRDFLKFCTATAGFLGLSELWVPKIAEAVVKASARPSVVWLNFASDTGCTEALVKSTYPDVAKLILDVISLDYNETIMAPAGKQAEKSLDDAIKKGGYVLIVEGGLPTKPGYGRIAGKEMTDRLKEAAANAQAVIAVGSCATYGGVPSGNPNPAAIKGVSEVLGQKVLNLDLCPVNPRVLTTIIVYYLLFKKIPPMDSFGRPLMFFSQTIHNNCERRAHFEAGEFVEQLGDENEAKQFCLYKMGCKGPMTFAPCPITWYDDRVSWCVKAGGPCIGCGEQNWQDKFAGFYVRLPEVTIPGFGGVETTADRIAEGIGIVAGAGIVVHAIASAVAGKGKSSGESGGGE